MNNNQFDIRDFRGALGQFPTGVTVITALDKNGGPIGCTASSFNSVSIDPALVLWSVDKSAFSAETFKNSEYFAVNVLSEGQVALSNRFAGRGEDKFKDISYAPGLGGAPLLEGCGAQFECKTWNVYEGGDHFIIVGEVEKYNHDDSLTPLVFSRGSYAVTSPHQGTDNQNVSKKSHEFLDDYLLYLLHSTISQCQKDLYPKFIEDCDITPEQWRVITVLSDSEPMNVKSLSGEVVQPIEELARSIQLLNEQGLLNLSEETVSLTKSGRELQTKLFNIAKHHEESLLKKLTPEQSSTLKGALRAIAGI